LTKPSLDTIIVDTIIVARSLQEMSNHIGAKKGDIAQSILLPGDPLRAQFIAEQFFENPVQYNTIRGMYGYTGTYKGKRISVQGTGMGIPSISIYVHELIQEYGVETLIRVGSCGSIQPDLSLREIIIAMAASTDSGTNTIRFPGAHFAPVADFELLERAWQIAKTKETTVKVGNIFSSDSFYHDDPEYWKKWAEYGVLGIEMEAAALYTLAAKFQAKALAVLTVSDNILTNEKTTPEERERTFTDMIEIALETV